MSDYTYERITGQFDEDYSDYVKSCGGNREHILSYTEWLEASLLDSLRNIFELRMTVAELEGKKEEKPAPSNEVLAYGRYLVSRATAV